MGAEPLKFQQRTVRSTLAGLLFLMFFGSPTAFSCLSRSLNSTPPPINSSTLHMARARTRPSDSNPRHARKSAAVAPTSKLKFKEQGGFAMHARFRYQHVYYRMIQHACV
eukprot:TRINITY_DN5145_c0_g4_i1.p1 TRINITY_DN5145_c0_g4~~TRINITY_DN5145_c0_g4_i1.p1  ORF type:complete len:110 (+),score=4.85 TRINITY_DN5145_c0_g4_i1:206-535(+)